MSSPLSMHAGPKAANDKSRQALFEPKHQAFFGSAWASLHHTVTDTRLIALATTVINGCQ